MLKTGMQRFFELPRDDRRLLLLAIGCLAAVKLALHWLPLPFTRQVLAHVTRLTASPKAQDLGRSIWAVSVASGLVPGGGNCLARALTLQTLLSRYSVRTMLHVGFAHDTRKRVEGHAWLTCEGRVVIGNLADLERFKCTTRAMP